jgi:two-component system cell cycle sensor histidine kinase/response regulator CckA
MSDSFKTKAELVAELNALRARVASLSAKGDTGNTLLFLSPNSDVDDFLETARAIVAEIDDEGRLLFISPTITDVLGYAAEDFVGKSMFDWFDDPTRVAALDQFVAIMRAGVTTRSIYQGRHALDHPVWLESVSSPFRAADGRLRIISVTHDVTRLKEAGDELVHSEDRYRAIAENASDLIVEVDREGRVLFASANSEAIVGRTPDVLTGRTLAEIGFSDQIHPDDRSGLVASITAGAPTSGGGRDVEFRYRHPDGSWHWIHAKAQGYVRNDGAMRGVIVARDITERVRAQEELHRSEERYRLVAEASHDIISELDATGRLTYSSPNVTDLLGYSLEEVVGSHPFGLVHRDESDGLVERFSSSVKTGSSVRSDPVRVRHRDGSWRWIEGVGLPYQHANNETRFLTVSRDVTDQVVANAERREFETRMLHAQKLESLGVLAGGVAHDFNNLLTPILGDASLALMELEEDSPVRIRLQRIQKAAHRAAALTNQMLAYAGTGPLVSEPLNFSALIEEMGRLLETAVSRQTSLAFEVRDDLPPVMGDAAQLSQVVMNLITNAAEALGANGGRITLRTGVVDGTQIQPFLSEPGTARQPGPHVFFDVIDTGCGMNAQTRSKIFDPFFTTKFIGRGLGLAAVLGIVRGHQGSVEIHSQVGSGTHFRVVLPACSEHLLPTARPIPTDAFDWRHRGTVIVIDDEEGVRDLATDTLERTGLKVLCASGGREGIALFRKMAHETCLVLLDRTMPETSGEQAYHEIRQIRPEVPILLISGYSEERAVSHFSDQGLAGFLQKPFTPEALIGIIRSVLDPPPAPADPS